MSAQFFRRIPAFHWVVLAMLSACISTLHWSLTPFLAGDHVHYQKFIERLAAGHLDFSVPGFHGADILAVPFYWLFRSPEAQMQATLFSSVLLPFVAYCAGIALFGSRRAGLFLSAIIAMMPFVTGIGFFGFTAPTLFLYLLLSVSLAKSRPTLAGLFLGLAILTKPFAIAFLPLLFVLSPKEKFSRRYGMFLAILLPAVYVIAQFAVTGHVHIGVHPNMNSLSVWTNPGKTVLNLAHAVQILFSIHNYYFPNPAGTTPGNLMQTTPVLMFLGIFGLLAYREFYQKRALPLSLFAAFAIGVGLNAMIDHIDHNYMITGVFALVLAALPVLLRYPLWFPIVIVTLNFQWLYFYLDFKTSLFPTYALFITPLVITIFTFVALAIWLWKPKLMHRLIGE